VVLHRWVIRLGVWARPPVETPPLAEGLWGSHRPDLQPAGLANVLSLLTLGDAVL
jgi:hypothetical protein